MNIYIHTKMSNNLKFFLNVMVYPFIHLYLIVGILGLVISSFAWYEQKSLMDLFANPTEQRSIIIFITTLTIMSSFRMTLHGILRHKMYMYTMNYFFTQVCMEKLEYWDKHYDKSEMIKCILNDITVYINTISKIFGILIRNVLTVVVVMYLLYKQNQVYLFFGLALCFLRSVLLEKLAKHWESKLDKVTEIKNELENEMTEYVNNNTQMQIYTLQNTYQRFINNCLLRYSDSQFVEAYWYGIFMLTFSSVQRLIEFSLYFFSQYKFNVNFYDSQLIVIYFKILTESVQSLIDIPKEISRNKDNINRLLKYINKPLLIHTDIIVNLENPVIQFHNVTFKYPSREKYIFENFNKTIEYQDKIVLFGNSGQGKSTLIKLLLGLYVPQNGHVTINNKDVTLLNNSNLQQIISIIPQEPIILENRTIKENITLFLKNEISDEQIKNVFKLVKLDNLIENLNDKIVTLSGGQKQRLALARVILDNNDIIILDEPFSGLDKTLKKEIQELIFNFVKDKTVILITHDIQVIENFGNAIFIDLN